MTGVFLKRGEYTNPLEEDKKWSFTPLAKVGDKVTGADWLGNVKENWLDHKIMVPFKLKGEYTVASIVAAGEYTIKDTIAVLKDEAGKEIPVTMVQKWPVKVAIRNYVDKPRPSRQMETGVRVIDTMNPILEGGTGFIPGPFGTGKTVLQHALSRFADVNEARNMLVRGRETAEQIDIVGDDGVPLEYHVVYWKSELIDFVILQQDAFDNIDGSTAMERQKYMLNMVLGVVRSEFNFDTFEEVNPYFKRIINGFKQMNYSEYQSEAFKKYEAEVNEIINERKK